MAGGLTPEFIEELKYKCDIVEVISQYVPLQKKGGRYFGCCPFHNEKTPSFCVNQQSGFYHCFGCGASGDVVKFIMEIESMTFYDAVKLLAEKANMTLPEIKLDAHYHEKKEHGEVLKALMRDVAVYYRNNLLDEEKGKVAREYLKGRGIDEDVQKRYGLGLSLDYDSMVSYLRRKEYKLADMQECGLISNVERPSDAFANRIIVPIINSMSEVIAFGGRIYHGEKDVAKYKNSTNTTLFDKGRTVYGINFVKRDKRSTGVVYKDLILVEGYMDVISLGSVGIKNVVAGMGTALTDGQAREIAKLTSTIYVCYDGDSAGKNATIKNVDTLVNAGLEVKVISLDNGADPDETVRNEGYDGFIKRKESALPVIEYKLKLCADANDLGSVNGRAKYVQQSLKVLKTIENKAEREVYLNIVSKNAHVSVETLQGDVGVVAPIKKPTVDLKEKEEKNLRASRFIVNRILDNAKYIVFSNIVREWLPHPTHQRILDFAITQPVGEVSVSKLYDILGYEDSELNKILGINLSFANQARESDYYDDCLSSLANDYIQGRLEYLKDQYNDKSSQDEKRAILQELAKLQKALKSKEITDKI